MGHFLSKNLCAIFFSKKSFESILSLNNVVASRKNQKNSMQWFLENSISLIQGQFWGPFCNNKKKKTPSKHSFSKESFCTITAWSVQIWSFFWYVIGHFSHSAILSVYSKTPKLQNKVIPKTVICVNCESLCCCNFMEKIRKVTFIDFWNYLKRLLGPFWAPFGSKTLK